MIYYHIHGPFSLVLKQKLLCILYFISCYKYGIYIFLKNLKTIYILSHNRLHCCLVSCELKCIQRWSICQNDSCLIHNYTLWNLPRKTSKKAICSRSSFLCSLLIDVRSLDDNRCNSCLENSSSLLL